MELKFFRSTASCEFSVWPEMRKVLFEISPSFPDKKGPPKDGERRYDYTKKIRISFNSNDILTFAYALNKMSDGINEEIKKYADMSKARFEGNFDTDKKSLLVSLNKEGGVSFFLTKGEQKLNIILNKSDAYAVAEWLKATYLVFYIKSTEGSGDIDESTEDQ